MPLMPELDDPASSNFTYRDLCEVGETWTRLRPDNTPREAATWAALAELAATILEPVRTRFGRITITYGHSGLGLYRRITARRAPELDQHAGFERNSRGNPICKRPGQAVDFIVADTSSLEVARFVVAQLPFDRLYYYGRDRPLHVSVGPEAKHDIQLVHRENGRHRNATRIRAAAFLDGDVNF
jgi:hypothetical protein